jgi:hypothetical protein
MSRGSEVHGIESGMPDMRDLLLDAVDNVSDADEYERIMRRLGIAEGEPSSVSAFNSSI